MRKLDDRIYVCPAAEVEDEDMSEEAQHYWQTCAEVDSLGRLAEAAEARQPTTVAASEDGSSDHKAAAEQIPKISQGVWIGRQGLLLSTSGRILRECSHASGWTLLTSTEC